MKKICWNSFHRDTSSKTMKRYAQLVMLLYQLLGESLCIFKHATRYLLPILCDSRSDVNCGSIQLFSWDSADRCDQANSIARGQNSSRDSITYAFVERARRVDLLSLPHNLHAHNVAWLWPGPICRWFGRVKPTRVIQILSRALVFDARSTKKNEQRKSDGGFAEPWVDEPSTWKCSSVLSIGDNAAPPSIDPLTQDSLEFRFFADAKVDRHGDIEIWSRVFLFEAVNKRLYPFLRVNRHRENVKDWRINTDPLILMDGRIESMEASKGAGNLVC